MLSSLFIDLLADSRLVLPEDDAVVGRERAATEIDRVVMVLLVVIFYLRNRANRIEMTLFVC